MSLWWTQTIIYTYMYQGCKELASNKRECQFGQRYITHLNLFGSFLGSSQSMYSLFGQAVRSNKWNITLAKPVGQKPSALPSIQIENLYFGNMSQQLSQHTCYSCASISIKSNQRIIWQKICTIVLLSFRIKFAFKFLLATVLTKIDRRQMAMSSIDRNVVVASIPSLEAVHRLQMSLFQRSFGPA